MIETYLSLLIIFVIGCCFGSFSSVVINRTLKNKKGIFLGHSQCPNCKHRLHAQDLIPVVSWIFNRGRCAYCQKPISIEYPALELITGLLFLSNYSSLLTNSRYFDFAQSPDQPVFFWLKFIYLSAISLILICICFSDLKTKTIPNIFLTILVALCLPAFLLTSLAPLESLFNVLIALAIALCFFGGQYLISRGRWLGSGDIFIAAAMAFLLGYQKLLLAIVLSYVLGSIVGIIVLIIHRKKPHQSIAFAPFLTMGTLISLYFGNQIISWYLSTLII